MPTVIPMEPDVINKEYSRSKACSDCKYWNRLVDTKDKLTGELKKKPEGLCTLASNNPLKVGDPMNNIYARAGSEGQHKTTQSHYCAGFHPKE